VANSCAQFYDYAQLSITVAYLCYTVMNLYVWLVYYDPVVHQAFDVLLDTIIRLLIDYL
jgi:hypothetical protein